MFHDTFVALQPADLLPGTRMDQVPDQDLAISARRDGGAVLLLFILVSPELRNAQGGAPSPDDPKSRQ